MTNELAIRILTGDVLGTASQTSEAIKTAVKALSMPSAQPEQPQLFQAIRKVCKYHTFSRDRYGTDKWEDACHCPVMIPQGSSWGECNEGICPVFNS